jgi:hypothetical protein
MPLPGTKPLKPVGLRFVKPAALPLTVPAMKVWVWPEWRLIRV